jgi:predicted O-linked N-acetylglucosamine transferase (SPINDLY family)
MQLWAQVLNALPNSGLLLLAPEGCARIRAAEQMAKYGVDPKRIEFAAHEPRARYFQLYHRIDVSLDTFPYGGHTTSLDSLWMGVPVVTLAGATAVGRAGVSQLTNLGLTELIARTPEDYVRIATELAGDLNRLGRLRSTLRDRMRNSPLTDAARFARNIEAAYRTMWETWCAGEFISPKSS